MIKKVIILAGGKGTRISEESKVKPKPMIKIGKIPIIEHIMNIYTNYGNFEFLIACGYKKEVLNEYFDSNFKSISKNENIYQLKQNSTVNLIDTGENSMTGKRIKIILDNFKDEYFHLTYGDGLSSIKINELTNFYFSSNTLATVTATRPPARFGRLDIDNEMVVSFGEKQQSSEGWINGGFFCINKNVKDYLSEKSDEPWESKPLENLAQNKQLSAYKHYGFWQPMDTLREKEMLEKMWSSGNAPWLL